MLKAKLEDLILSFFFFFCPPPLRTLHSRSIFLLLSLVIFFLLFMSQVRHFGQAALSTAPSVVLNICAMCSAPDMLLKGP